MPEECTCWECRRADEDRYEATEDVVFPFDYTPSLMFRSHKHDERYTPKRTVPYLGLELEMERARDHAHSIQGRFDYHEPDLVYLKTDGSLSYDGVELVTHPATFEWLMAHFPWDELRETALEGAVSYRDSSCGIHIHISSSAFTPSHLFKFLAFHYRNAQVCQAVGQRASVGYSSWSEWLSTRPDIVKYAKKEDMPHNRYMAVNLTNHDTIELRYFRGNLDPSRVRKNLQWVDAAFRYTRTVPGISSAEGLRFSAMVPWLERHEKRYPDLLKFLRERGVIRTKQLIGAGSDL